LTEQKNFNVQAVYEQINSIAKTEDEREGLYDELVKTMLERFLNAAQRAQTEGLNAREFILALGSSDSLENLLGTLFIAAKQAHRPLISQLYSVLNGMWAKQ
jgi:hypothetical protein